MVADGIGKFFMSCYNQAFCFDSFLPFSTLCVTCKINNFKNISEFKINFNCLVHSGKTTMSKMKM